MIPGIAPRGFNVAALGSFTGCSDYWLNVLMEVVRSVVMRRLGNDALSGY